MSVRETAEMTPGAPSRRHWLLAGGLLVVGLIVVLGSRPPAVQVVQPRAQVVAQTLTASGEIVGAQESVLAPESSGVLTEVLVEPGQTVQAGQPVARLTSQVLQAEVARAAAAVAAARAQLREAQAQEGEVSARTRQVQAESARALQQAEIRLAQAQRDLARAHALANSDATAGAGEASARAGLAQAQARVARAEALAANAEGELIRARRLFEAGAIARARLEAVVAGAAAAQEDVALARGQVAQARVEFERQRAVRTTSRTEEVERAREALARAQAELTAVREAGPAQVEAVAATPVAQRVAVAQERVREAEQAQAVAGARLTTATVRARYTGVVTEVLSRPGEVVGPTRGVVRLTQLQRPEARIDLDEREVRQVVVGQPAVLVADAAPMRSLPARVTAISAQADPQRGTVEVTLRPTVAAPWLRAGYTVDATIVVDPPTRHLIVPTTTVIREGDRTWVLLVEAGRVRRRRVLLGTSGAAGTVVLSGLGLTDRVVRAPLTVREGQRVRVAARAPAFASTAAAGAVFHDRPAPLDGILEPLRSILSVPNVVSAPLIPPDATVRKAYSRTTGRWPAPVAPGDKDVDPF
jgi:HlyD family secretion protein